MRYANLLAGWGRCGKRARPDYDGLLRQLSDELLAAMGLMAYVLTEEQLETMLPGGRTAREVYSRGLTVALSTRGKALGKQ